MNATTEHLTKAKPFMTCEELCDMLPNRSLRSIQNDCRAGRIPAKKLGHKWVIPREKTLSMLGL